MILLIINFKFSYLFMETEDQVVLKSKPNVPEDEKKKTKKSDFSIFYSKISNFMNFELNSFNNYLFPLVVIFLVFLLLFFIFKKSDNKKNGMIVNTNIRGIEDSLEFDLNKLELYKKEQNDFCNDFEKNKIKEYEEQIQLTNVYLLSRVFNMYVYKSDDEISNEIMTLKNFNGEKTGDLLTALLFYSTIKKINASQIYFLDIGSKIGWYSMIMSKFGYKVLSFESSDINNYILKKNYCLNREFNLTLIKKGLYNEEKKCDYYLNSKNKASGKVYCEVKQNLPSNLIKSGESTLTRLSNYLNFLTNQNLALVKISVEGLEEKVIQGGIELITNYHVPYIYLEFNPESLREQGTDPIKFLKIFIRNKYRFPFYNFFDDEFLSIDEIMTKARRHNGKINLYIAHAKMIRKYQNS